MAQLPPEQLVSIAFPVHGLDLNRGFGQQAPQSTRVGQNVRVVEPDSERARGGSRPGLAKYLTAQLPNGAHLIQHLAVVINPGGEGLLANYDDENWTWYDPSDNPPQSNPADPTDLRVRNRNRQLPEGGTGIQQSVRLLSNKVTPEIIWDLVGGIWSGEALSAVQLMATAVDPETRLTITDGTFTYNPTFGVLLSAGAHNLRVKFTPEDTNYYRVAYGREAILVSKRTPTITWTPPERIIPDTPLSGTQLNATATDPVTSAAVAGTFTYTPPSGTVLEEGDHQELLVSFTASNGDYYNLSTGTNYLDVRDTGIVFVQGILAVESTGGAVTTTLTKVDIDGYVSGSFGNYAIPYPTACTAGNFLVAVIVKTLTEFLPYDGDIVNHVTEANTLTDNQGQTWTRAGAYIRAPLLPLQAYMDWLGGGGAYVESIDISVWYVANCLAGATTVTVQFGQTDLLDVRYICLLEYSGVATHSPLRATGENVVYPGHHIDGMGDFFVDGIASVVSGTLSANADDLQIFVGSRTFAGISFNVDDATFVNRAKGDACWIADKTVASGAASVQWNDGITSYGTAVKGVSFRS